MRRSDEMPNLGAQEARVARDPWYRPGGRIPDQGEGQAPVRVCRPRRGGLARRGVRPLRRAQGDVPAHRVGRWLDDRRAELKLISPRMESGRVYMADAYDRASGKVAPVYTSTGPGPMLLTVAMANAFYDSSAFVALTGPART